MASRFMGNKKMMPGPGIMSMLPESRPIRPPREFISPLGPADKPMRLPPAPSMQGLAGLQERLGSLESRERFDPTGLQEQIDALSVRDIVPFDPTGLQARIGDLEGRQMFDPSGLKSRIGALEGRQMFDPTALQEQIAELQGREMFDPTGLQEQIAELQGRQMFDPTGLQEQITALQEARPNVPPSLMGITMDPAPDPITGDRYPVISIEEEPAVDFKKDPVPAMSMVEQLQQMIADMQAQQQTQAAQQQEQAAARAAQEAEMSKQYLIPAGPQGYNPYLSGQYQGDPYGAQGVPSMGGITTIPVPEDYLGV
tara:strand:- start:1050 stop:1985 length:936 start_codon:yes stop_codon:yes gene_type:complete